MVRIQFDRLGKRGMGIVPISQLDIPSRVLGFAVSGLEPLQPPMNLIGTIFRELLCLVGEVFFFLCVGLLLADQDVADSQTSQAQEHHQRRRKQKGEQLAISLGELSQPV